MEVITHIVKQDLDLFTLNVHDMITWETILTGRLKIGITFRMAMNDWPMTVLKKTEWNQEETGSKIQAYIPMNHQD